MVTHTPENTQANGPNIAGKMECHTEYKTVKENQRIISDSVILKKMLTDFNCWEILLNSNHARAKWSTGSKLPITSLNSVVLFNSPGNCMSPAMRHRTTYLWSCAWVKKLLHKSFSDCQTKTFVDIFAHHTHLQCLTYNVLFNLPLNFINQLLDHDLPRIQKLLVQ